MLVLFLPFSEKQTSCLDIYRDNIFLFPEVLFSDNFLPRLQKSFFGIWLSKRYDIRSYMVWAALCNFIFSLYKRTNRRNRKLLCLPPLQGGYS